MRQKERHDIILDTLRRNNSVSVSELASVLPVSRETIRMDLQCLEQKQLLVRTHGGAVNLPQNQDINAEIPYYERESVNIKEKQEIAELALRYIRKNDRIVLDSSSTCVYLARELPNIPLIVLTNSVRIISEIAVKDKIEVFFSGGMLLRSSMCMVGRDNINPFQGYHVDKAFVSCSGVVSTGVTEANELAILAKLKMLSVSDEAYLLVDHTKFGFKDFLMFSSLDAFDMILTDSETAEQQIELLEKHAGKVVRADPFHLR
jgi:DeoR/GlpR family transcriptional regulator of sugar metabolism